MDLAVIEGTSAAEYTEIEVTSNADSLAGGERMQIEGTSAIAKHTDMKATSDAESTKSGERTQIKGTSDASEHTEIEATSDTLSMESWERTQIERTSAATEHTEKGEIIEWPKHSIFRAPAHIRSGRESNFQPKLVSIGPYYHGQENLRRMEDFKIQCITELLQKQLVTNHPRPLETGIRLRRNQSIYNGSVEPSTQGKRGIHDVPLEQFMSSGERARAYYKQEFDHSDVEFVRMLILDSCFIIRIILSLSQPVHEFMAFLDEHVKDVRSDLLLLENQIPLFFTRKVYEWLFPHRDHTKFPPAFEIVLQPFICLDMPWTINHDAMKYSEDAAHLLDLYWRCSLSPPMYKTLSEQEGGLSEQEGDHTELEQSIWTKINVPMMMANATELHMMVGLTFEKSEDKCPLNVNFSNGIMRMPRLKIDTRLTTLLINLLALENCILPSMRNFTYYMKLMDTLIDSEKDVQLLHKCGVIYNTLSSHEMAATFFNDIGNICFIDYNTNPFSDLYKDVQKYYDSSWRRSWHSGHLLSLRQNYFSSPWTTISVVAAGTLLILSALQTFYTIYAYYKPKK